MDNFLRLCLRKKCVRKGLALDLGNNVRMLTSPHFGVYLEDDAYVCYVLGDSNVLLKCNYDLIFQSSVLQVNRSSYSFFYDREAQTGNLSLESFLYI